MSGSFENIIVDYLLSITFIPLLIKFTSAHSLTNVPFLDVMVSLDNGIIETDLFIKPTDKKAIPFSLALCLRLICSTDVTIKAQRIDIVSTAMLAKYRPIVSRRIA